MVGNEILLLGLGIQVPWRLVDQHSDMDKQPHKLRVQVCSERGTKYACPVWCAVLGARLPGEDVAASEFLSAPLLHPRFGPRVKCPEHGVKLVEVP